MSKIGRKPIDISNVQVEIKGQELHYKGGKNSGVFVLPAQLKAEKKDSSLVLVPSQTQGQGKDRDLNRVWGLNRALLYNAIVGSHTPFVKELQINGLGFKAALSGQLITFNLGHSHKETFELPKQVSLEIDKTGQKLTFKSADKFLIGHICSKIKALRPTEPYKGTGIKLSTDVIVRKAGKTKAS